MAASREWTLWHLTPSGWVAGTTKLDFSREERPIPPDRVKTVEYREEMSSPFSRLEMETRVEWVGDGEGVARLEEQHGPCPRHLG